jgi:hypothetical protein
VIKTISDQTLFADGHVRLISDSVALPVWRALSRDGNEPVSDAAYWSGRRCPSTDDSATAQ